MTTNIESLIINQESVNKASNDGVTITNSLLLLYLFGANKYIYKLMPEETVKILESNKYIHHIISFITIMIIMSYILKKKSKKKVIIYALICYVWFLLTIKLPPVFLLSLLSILIMGYITEMLITDKTYEMENIQSDVMSEEEKESKLTKLKRFRTFFISVALLTTLCGYIYPQTTNTDNNGNMTGGGHNSSILDYLFN